ncbi:MAG: GNAT family N-acetyltransferase [Deltaproteobacteria bacterium]|nr:GNAT family N-acetyltransferase [Deltaproteobacteria bacterium]
MNIAAEIIIKTGYIPGSIGRISELHGTYYNRHWGFGLYFEAKVATELSAFLERFDAKRDGIWLATQDGHIEGAVVIDGIHAENEGAHLRWFIMSDALRGKGVGRKLIHSAVDFCRGRGYETVYLWTFEGLGPARHLYEDAGFKLIGQNSGDQWGTQVNEQYFELRNDG